MAQIHGQGPILAGGATSEVFTTPYPHVAGARVRDETGNEYVFVNYGGGPIVTGQVVAIQDDYTAIALATTGRGRIGVSAGGGTSDDAGWVQVYGRVRMMIGQGTVSVSETLATTISTSVPFRFALATSLTSPAGLGWVTAPSLGRERFMIEGVYVATDASPSDVSDNLTSLTSLTTPIHSTATTGHIGVFLNYPMIRYEFPS